MYRYIKNRFTIAILVLFAPLTVSAASVSLDVENRTFAKGSDVSVKVLMDVEGEVINAVEGKLVYPKELVGFVDIQDGNSAVNFWIERPHVVEEGTISFSGITAGGISRPKASLFEVILHAKAVGDGNLDLSGVRLLRNDGNGTEVKAKTAPLSFAVEASSTTNFGDLSITDTTAPEDFLPIVGSSTDIFEGRYFLVFDAEDKGSGIDHYEVKEGMFGRYIEATSPFVLNNQALDKEIYVKAVDKKGNEKVVKLRAQNHMPLYQELMILAIMILVAISILKKKLWRKSKK